MTTNITIRIADELAREAKVLAAQRGLSLSRLVAEELERIVTRDFEYDRARVEAVLAIEEAGDLNYVAEGRNSLHER